MPEDRRCHADRQRLDHHRDEDLRARRAQRAQQSELARALCDRDRERVEDDEGADQQRGAREREQRRSEEAADRVVRGVGRLGGIRGAGRHGQRAWQRASYRGGESRGGDARLGGDRDPRDLVRALEPALNVGERRHHERGAAERHALAPLGDAGDRDALNARAGAEADVLAHAQPLVAGELVVDDDLARLSRRVAFEVAECVEGLLARGADDGRSESGGDRLAPDDQRSGLGQLPFGAANARDRAHACDATPVRWASCSARDRRRTPRAGSRRRRCPGWQSG